ncbi:zinc ABC transporter substrate-binding protein [Halobacillus sp. HZG1]|uniref:metal ABC transporter solute-binding protein, Zn/Mn family n=1 Tax=Halobacillus sp. HZG1 TaxID=3111769 RepID=UPI002DBB424C|nr:zinc ABC transporter substrate-binding protein [Halobacillus sp. HZG1]MEC3882711.1 zinc ABC transporter substrate-binding protein [Halobacillus sp. HZG1]
MKKLAIMLSFILTILLITACGNEETATEQGNEKTGDDNGELNVYTTVYPLQFFTEKIGGETVNVHSILPPGSDAHTYEPTTKEMVKMAEADLFVYNGAGLEGYAKKISESIQPEGVEILEAAGDLDLKEHVHNHGEGAEGEDHHGEDEHAHGEDEHGHEEDEHAHEEDEHAKGEDSHDGHGHGEKDPHVWLDPVRAVQMAEGIKNQLIEMNPEEEELYEENYEELQAKLMDLDQAFHERVESKAKSKIIVSHAAYGYWEEAYGIEQIAVSGLSPTNEPSQKDLENIVQVAESNNLEYVVFEQNITPKVSEVIQNEIGAEALRFHNLSVLTKENVKNDEDYFSLMEQNLDVLTQALSK